MVVDLANGRRYLVDYVVHGGAPAAAHRARKRVTVHSRLRALGAAARTRVHGALCDGFAGHLVLHLYPAARRGAWETYEHAVAARQAPGPATDLDAPPPGAGRGRDSPSDSDASGLGARRGDRWFAADADAGADAGSDGSARRAAWDALDGSDGSDGSDSDSLYETLAGLEAEGVPEADMSDTGLTELEAEGVPEADISDTESLLAEMHAIHGRRA